MQKILPLLIVALLASFVSCRNESNSPAPVESGIDYAKVIIPETNADSAFAFVKAQTDLGFRHPGCAAHELCAKYLATTMARWCDTVIVQDFGATLWNGSQVRGKNIIASLNPENETRILLAAHWDSRLWADHDPNKDNVKKPIMGANDGASGVGALMEMARVMSAMPPSVGIDFIFFDLEDQGLPDWADTYEDNTWCKGSQYWAKVPHRPFYQAEYGILFDMVGSAQPRFTKEEISRHYAPGLTNKIWQSATALGFGDVFQDKKTDAILDDHMYVNQIAGIPTADIVQNSPDCSFVSYWHTLGDDIDKIEPKTLKMVADVTLATIYGDHPAKP